MSNYAAATAKGVAHAIGAAAAPILVLGVAAILATVQSVELDIGLSEELQLRFRRRRSFATRLTFTGLFFTFGLPVAYLLVFEEPRQLVMQIALGASAIIGLITMIVGLLYYAIAVPPTMKILTTDGKHVWFDGVHPDFLAKLPNFPRD